MVRTREVMIRRPPERISTHRPTAIQPALRQLPPIPGVHRPDEQRSQGREMAQVDALDVLDTTEGIERGCTNQVGTGHLIASTSANIHVLSEEPLAVLRRRTSTGKRGIEFRPRFTAKRLAFDNEWSPRTWLKPHVRN